MGWHGGRMTSRSCIALFMTLGLMLLVGVLTLVPLPPTPQIGGSDKTHHMIAFAALIFPAAVLRPRWVVGLSLILAAYGGAIEIIQPYVGRSGEWADWVADLIGIAAGVACGLVVRSTLRGILRRAKAPAA